MSHAEAGNISRAVHPDGGCLPIVNSRNCLKSVNWEQYLVVVKLRCLTAVAPTFFQEPA